MMIRSGLAWLAFVCTLGSVSASPAFASVQPGSAAPVVSVVSPSAVAVEYGGPIRVVGQNLANPTAVKLNGTPAVFHPVSASEIDVDAPKGWGLAQLQVITAAGDSNTATLAYESAPTIASASPSTVPTSGGATVTLHGTDLDLADNVQVDEQPAVILQQSATSILFQAPAHPQGQAMVAVQTDGHYTHAVAVTYSAPPTTTGASPATGSVNGGTQTTVTGTNLQNTTKVTVGGQPVQFSASPTTVTFATPAHSVGIAEIALEDAGTILNTSFTYVDTPLPTIVTQPRDGDNSCADQTYSFDITALGKNLTYQWQIESTGHAFQDIPDATHPHLDLPSAAIDGDGTYLVRAIVRNPAGTTTSNNAQFCITHL